MSVVHRYTEFHNNRFHPEVLDPEGFIVMQDKDEHNVYSVKDVYELDAEEYPKEITCPWCKERVSFDDASPSFTFFELPEDLNDASKTDEEKIYDWYALLICQKCRTLELKLEQSLIEKRKAEEKEEGAEEDV